MKKIYCFFFVLFFSAGVSQAQEYIWSRRAVDSIGGAYYYWWGNNCNNCNGIVGASATTYWWNYGSAGTRNSTVDRDGNTYIFGTFNGTIKIGSFVLNASPPSAFCILCGLSYTSSYYCKDFYVAKFDSAKNVVWAVSGGGAEYDAANAIAVDQDGNCYIAGTMNGTNAVPVNFGSSVALYPQGQDGFVAKINSNGTWAWAHKLTGASDECVSAVNVDRFGNCYVAGSGTGFIKVSSYTFVSTPAFNGGRDVFVAKIDNQGLPIWMRSGGSNKDDYPADITVDNTGNVYVGLNLLANASFGSVSLSNTGQYGAVLKYNAAGVPQWGLKAGRHVVAMTSDIYDNILFTGVYNTTSTFGSDTYTPFAANKNDIYIAKVNGLGAYQWSKRLGSDETENPIWPSCGGCDTTGDWPSDIEVDMAGNVYLSGSLTGDSKPGSVCLLNNMTYYPNYTYPTSWYWGKRTGFVIKVNADGTCGWNIKSKSYPGTWAGFTETVNGVGLDNYGNVYFSGNSYFYYWSSVTYPLYFFTNGNNTPVGSLSQTTSTSPYWYWGAGEYLVRFRNTEVIYCSPDKQVYCVGDSMIINYQKYGIFAANNKFVLQLSDTNGGFSNPINLDSVATNQSGQFRIKLSNTLLPGTGYRVRVNSTLPNVSGFPNNRYMTISVYPDARAGLDADICQGDSVRVNAGDGWYYKWTPATGMSADNGASPWFKPTTTTTYILRTYNPGNCSDFDTININVHPRARAIIPDTIDLCELDTILINASASVGTKFRWNSSYNIEDTTYKNPRVWPVVDTVYKLTASNAWCSDSAKVRFRILPLPRSNYQEDTSICFGDTLKLFLSSNAAVMNWTPPNEMIDNGDFVPQFFPKADRTYKMLAQSDKGCKKEGKLTIRVKSLPTISLTKDSFLCKGETKRLQVSGGIKYKWSPLLDISFDSINGTVDFSNLQSRRYQVRVEDSKTCVDTASVWMEVKKLPTVDAGNATFVCIGDSTQLNATGAQTYQWKNDPALSQTTIPQPKAAPVADTWFKVTGTDQYNCKNNDSVFITVKALPAIQVSPKNALVCYQGSTTLKATGGVQYTWSPAASINNPNIDEPEVYPQVPAYYRVKGTDANGCVNYDSAYVDIRLPVPVNAGLDVSICRGADTTLQASGAMQYSWSPTLALSDPNVSNPKAFPAITTQYVVKGTDVNNCNGYDTVEVNVLQLPVVNASEDRIICEKDSTELTAQSPGATAYLWLPGGQSGSSITAKPSVTTQYKVRAFDGKCWSLEEPVQVYVEKIPDVSIRISKSEGRPPLRVRFNSQTSSQEVVGYLWDFGDSLGTSTEADPTYTYEQAGTYRVKLRMFTSNGCYNDAVFEHIKVFPGPTIFVPNAFSPNDDGVNDFLRIEISSMRWAKMRIFNLWGEQVYEYYWAPGENGSYWDGSYNGKQVPDGVYAYTIEAKGLDGSFRYLKGEINVMR